MLVFGWLVGSLEVAVFCFGLVDASIVEKRSPVCVGFIFPHPCFLMYVISAGKSMIKKLTDYSSLMLDDHIKVLYYN